MRDRRYLPAKFRVVEDQPPAKLLVFLAVGKTAVSGWLCCTEIPAPLTPNPIEPLVTRILMAKNDNPTSDVTTPEAQIDQLVYQLYSLSAVEIAIVEGVANE